MSANLPAIALEPGHDDHPADRRRSPIVRDGLRGIFTADEGFEVLGEAATGDEAVALAEKLRPGVVLMDLRMPRGNR